MKLRVDGVEFSYNGSAVLKGITFEAEAGDVVAVLGPNGAGKSTLLRCINAILKPKRGVVLVDGKTVGGDVAKVFGYVPQKSGGNFMTVFDAVLLGRKPHMGLRPNERDLQIVEEVLGLMGLKRIALKMTNKISGGELQKVVIARALAQEPKVLLLDEPTNNLDLKSQHEVMRLVRQISKEKGVISIVVMHDVNLALRYADKFLVMKNGEIIASGGREVITPGLIKEVYGVDAHIEHVRGIPVVVPI
ncbi:hypothetical protein PAP_08650 [Palaeococcus pacificus DY20341]|uniref:ABC transporter domain-containing protein n=1 Tax=Palaeococcus pacificus DY20341 TaxID=1343739 RepID=A0A075LVG0_9EURY|nr:ABC transporter ATP-binding protein [Palaeococcus pacificus]AIF70111.1 hypothetical protein PAP_08650 [Palaeococcus pacificus DY20341]